MTKGLLFNDVQKFRSAPLQDITTTLIKVELEECQNILYNEHFGWKDIKGGSLGRQFSRVYQRSGLVLGQVASARDWLLRQSNIH